MKISTIAVATLVIAQFTISPFSYAQNNDLLRQLVVEAMPKDVGNKDVIADLMNPKVGPQFSENWSARNALRAVRDKLNPAQDCFSDTRPDGDPGNPQQDCTYVSGEINGRESASLMRVNLAEGALKYINRGREMDPRGEDNPLSSEEVTKTALELANLFGIPSDEIARQFVTASSIMATAAPENPQTGDKVIRKRMEMFATLPRCMPVAGQVISDCVPVFNSGMRMALNSQSLPSWTVASWPNFKMDEAADVLSQSEVVNLTVKALEQESTAQPFEAVQIFIAYVQNNQLTAADDTAHCPSDEADEKDPEPEVSGVPTQTPPNLAKDRMYVPAIVVYSKYQEYEEGSIKPESQTVSTGMTVRSFPLVKVQSSEC